MTETDTEQTGRERAQAFHEGMDAGMKAGAALMKAEILKTLKEFGSEQSRADIMHIKDLVALVDIYPVMWH